MRKTNVVKTLKIVLLLILISLFYSNNVQAADATISVSNCNVGEDFTVNINFSNDVLGYEGDLKVTYSNGTTEYLTRLAGNSNSWVGNFSEKFKAQHAGNATITASNLKLYDLNSMNNITYDPNSGGSNFNPANTIPSLVATITISDPSAQVAPEPEQTSNNEQPADSTQTSASTAPVTLNFRETNEKMYTNRRVNVRQSYGTDSSIIQTLIPGTEVTRTGISDGNKDGYSWSRVSYNGITGYLITGALTSDAPNEEEPEENLDEDPVEDEEISEDDNITVEAIAEELGAIPEVGVNIMPFMFIGSVVACSVLMIEVKRRLA